MKKIKVGELLAFKANIAEVFAVAIVLGLGINVLSTGIVGFLDLASVAALLVGGVMVCLGLLYVAKKLRPANSGIFKFEAGIYIGYESNKLLAVHEYEFAQDISKYVEALCSENKAIAQVWSRQSIGMQFVMEQGVPVRVPSKANQLLLEAVEYFALNLLSSHLSSYFQNDDSLSFDELTTFRRKDIPSVLLDNRFLEVFSKPMEEREAFLRENEPLHADTTNVVYASGKDGAIFERFDLILPKGSSVVREDDSSVTINTKRFKLNICPVFEGFSGVFPVDFPEIYMGKDFGSVSDYHVNLILSVEFSMASLITSRGWEYYWWLDSFLEKVEASCSVKSFLEQVGWHHNAALVHMLKVNAASIGGEGSAPRAG